MSRLPRRGRISIHAPLTGSDSHLLHCLRNLLISIHAPLTGSDFQLDVMITTFYYFNPRSPYGERRAFSKRPNSSCRFQSTLPLRGATSLRFLIVVAFSFQSTLPLRGATRSSRTLYRRIPISIHAPLTGSDRVLFSDCRDHIQFQSTLPLRGATRKDDRLPFGPKFQSTLPLRGATICPNLWMHPARFQSTLPLRGATAWMRRPSMRLINFNPRSPYGERPVMDYGIKPPY